MGQLLYRFLWPSQGEYMTLVRAATGATPKSTKGCGSRSHNTNKRTRLPLKKPTFRGLANLTYPSPPKIQSSRCHSDGKVVRLSRCWSDEQATAVTPPSLLPHRQLGVIDIFPVSFDASRRGGQHHGLCYYDHGGGLPYKYG